MIKVKYSKDFIFLEMSDILTQVQGNQLWHRSMVGSILPLLILQV